MKNNNDFEFNYSAPTTQERREIESIRNSYLTQNKSTDKLSHLRKLDNKVKNTPVILSLILGVVGILIFGLGLSMILEWTLYIWGSMVCAVGLIPVSLAYPTYLKATKILKEKYSEEILKISDELLNPTDKK